MLDLADYFNNLDLEFQSKSRFNKGTFGSGFFCTDFDEAKIVLIGLSETRNAFEANYSSSPDFIRSKLYNLSASDFDLAIYDLGNLKSGSSLKDTYASIEFITAHLIELGKIPLFFGGSNDLLVPITKNIANKKNCNTVLIDSKADISSSEEFHSQSYLQHLKRSKEYELNLSLLAYQGYFNTQEQTELCTKHQIEMLRLGNIRKQISETEPYFRDADIVSIDMTAVRFPDYQASKYLSPNGLYAEEICQLANLAGMSDRTQLYHISEYNSDLDNQQQSAHLIAQVAWHLIHGINQRKKDYPARDINSYKKIYVSIDKTDANLIFYQNAQNNRFWIEIPKGNDEITLLSCSENDYRAICNNSIPDRIARKIAQYLK